MRGHQHPAVHVTVTEAQASFGSFSRHRRWKLARGAQTTLVKAHQWGNGVPVEHAVAAALESAVKALLAKQSKPA